MYWPSHIAARIRRTRSRSPALAAAVIPRSSSASPSDVVSSAVSVAATVSDVIRLTSSGDFSRPTEASWTRSFDYDVMHDDDDDVAKEIKDERKRIKGKKRK